MSDQELLHTLALLKTEGIGDVIAKRLLHHLGSAEAVFAAKPMQLAKIEGIGSITLKNIKKEASFKEAEEELKFIQDQKIKPLFYQDTTYPERLKHCFDGPVLLFTSGNIDLHGQKILSVVGTRQVTPYGVDFCKKLITDLAPLNPVIVSGFAYGVDIVAHLAALENQLQTIGILAHGLNQIYPKAHKKYRKAMEENGGFMTDFWSTSNPDREHFVRRNRIVAGLSEATLVIESAEKGGSLITANMANDYDREVFAVPGRTTDKFSQGCNMLLKTNKAQVLTCVSDIVYHLGWELQARPKAIQSQLFVALEPNEQRIYDYLASHGKDHLDSLAKGCELPVFSLSSLLITMELKGVIRPLPGKYFEII